MRPDAAKPNFADRLRNYSRMVSTKLEFKGQSAVKIAGLSAAAGLALSAHHAAEAAITYSGPVNLNVTASFTWALPKAYFNIDGLANFGISAAWFPYYSIYGLRQVAFGTTGTVNSTGVPGPNGEQIVFAPGFQGNQPDKLAQGQVIDSNSPFFAPAIPPGHGNKALIQANNYGGFISGNNWPNPAYPNSYTSTNPNAVGAMATGYAGIRFNTSGGTGKHYGWVRLQITNVAAGGYTPVGQVSAVTVLDWAYETAPNTAIMTGDGIPAPVDGDFDGDGDVDGADFLMWQRGEVSDPPSASDLLLWQDNFGAGGGSLPGASVVPEPGTATLLSLGLLATGAAGLRRQRKVKKG